MGKPLKVLHVVTTLSVGGLEMMVIRLIGEMASRGVESTVCCLESRGGRAVELEDQGVRVHALNKKYGFDLKAVLKLAALIRQGQYDIVHSHNPQPHMYAVVASWASPSTIPVHTKHGRNYPDQWRRVWLYRMLSWWNHRIIPVSDNAREIVLKIEKVNPVKVTRIWNGIDTRQFVPPPASLDRSPHPWVVGTVARLSPEKDQITLLATIRLLRGEGCDVRALVIGDGPRRQTLEHCAAEWGLQEHVEFVGEQRNVSDWLWQMDVFVLSSLTEGISLTLIEAMATGLPCVATDVGGNREVINPPECGLVVPAKDPQALANAIRDVLTDPMRRRKMGECARHRAVRCFDLSEMVKAYRKVYDEVCAVE